MLGVKRSHSNSDFCDSTFLYHDSVLLIRSVFGSVRLRRRYFKSSDMNRFNLKSLVSISSIECAVMPNMNL